MNESHARRKKWLASSPPPFFSYLFLIEINIRSEYLGLTLEVDSDRTVSDASSTLQVAFHNNLGNHGKDFNGIGK